MVVIILLDDGDVKVASFLGSGINGNFRGVELRRANGNDSRFLSRKWN